MKKLMTMLAAAAMAFGLYADAYEQTESFEGSFAVDGTTWVTNAADTATVEVQTYGSDVPTKLPEAFATGAGEKFLAVKTELKADGTRGLKYNFEDETSKEIGDGVYFDGLVNFTTACDETTVEVAEDVKLVAYAVDMTEVEGGTAGNTNLFITAGYYNNGEWEKKAYDCGNIGIYQPDESGFCRLTIRALGNISKTETVPGFLVFVNGQAVDTDNADIGYTDLTDQAAAWNMKGNLFPSLNQDPDEGTYDVINSVTIAGQGLIDCFVLTRTCPKIAQDEIFTLKNGDHVASLKYTIGDSEEKLTLDGAGASVDIPYYQGLKVTVQDADVTYETVAGTKFGRGEWTLNGQPFDGNVFQPQANMIGVVNGTDVTPRVEVTIGSEEPKTYPTIAAAVADIALLPQGTQATLKFNEDMDVGANESVSELMFYENSDVILDLNGKTITGTATLADKYVVQSVGKLQIIDSSTVKNGSIKIGDGASYLGVVGSTVATAELTIDAGNATFDGVVAMLDGAIKSGKFDEDNTTDEEFSLAAFVDPDNYDTTFVDQYWVVTPATKWTVTFYDADKTTVLDEQEVKNGETVDEPDEPTKDYYDFDKWVDADGQEFDFATPITADTSLYATWTAKEYTLSFETDGGTEIPDVTFSKETGLPDLSKYETTKDGYDFGGWFDETYENEITAITEYADITVYAAWTEATYAITYTFKDDKGGDVDDADILTNNLPEEYTFGAGAEFDANDITTSDKYVAGSATFLPTEITDTDFGDKEVVVTLTLASVEPARPSDIDSGSDDQKKVYDAWKAKQEADGKTVDPTDPLTVDRSILDMPADATSAQLEAKLATVITDTMLKGLVDGTDFTGEFTLEDYPNATFKFVETDVIPSVEGVSKFWRLTAYFTPANKQ